MSKEKKVYVGETLRWDWVPDWQTYVQIAKRYGCRFNSETKAWSIPNFSTAVEIVRSLLESGFPASMIEVTDYETSARVEAAHYLTAAYSRERKGLGKKMALGLELDGRDAYLAIPLDKEGKCSLDHALYYGLAKDGCRAEWVMDRGFLLKENAREAIDYLVTHTDIPVRGCPPIYETPFVVDTYDRIMPHQAAGVTFLVNRRRAILADDMGLGKTMQAIVAAEALKCDGKAKALLIVPPVTLTGNWKKELAMWESSFEDVFIVPYSRLKHLPEILKAYPQGEGVVLIADEAHYLKSPTSQRTKAMMQFTMIDAPKLAAVWLMTGTPVTRDFSNLWPMASILGHPVSDIYRPSEMAEMSNRNVLNLSGALRTHMLIRKKSDLLDLPPKIRQVRQTDTGLERLMNLKLIEILAHGKDEAAMEHLMTLKRLSAEAKVEETIEMAAQILEEGRKVVLFSDHTKAIDKIVEAFRKHGVVAIDGRTKERERPAIVERFQTDPSCRVFVGNMKAAGVGVTLTAAADVIFNDFTWLPSDMHQAEDRCHRIGAKGTVNIYYMADCNLILDDILSRKLAERSAEIATFEQSSQSILREIRAWAKEKLAKAA